MAEELWEIKVSVPMRLPGWQRDVLFAAVVRAVSDWEPDERDGWDADVAGCPAAEWPEIVDLQASRQAWAEEAMRLDSALDVIAEHCEELSAKADTKIGEVVGADLAWAAWGRAAQWMRHARNQRPCSLPECVVHPASSSVLPEGEAP